MIGTTFVDVAIGCSPRCLHDLDCTQFRASKVVSASHSDGTFASIAIGHLRPKRWDIDVLRNRCRNKGKVKWTNNEKHHRTFTH